MTTADKLEWPQGTPLFELAFRAVSEGMNGVGVLAAGDMEVSATANANEISVGTGDLWVPDTTYSIGTAETHTLSDNTSGSDRWDTVVFDTSLSTPASAVVEGTAGADPEPPDLSSGQILLAYIYVPDGATDTPDSNIYNWRAFSTDAADVRLDDSAGDFQNSNVEDAFTEVIREAGDPLNGTLDLSSFSGPPVLDLGTNPGAFGAIVDATVDSNSAAGTAHTFDFAVDGTTLLQVYAESDGAGGVQNAKVVINSDADLPTGSVDTGEIADAAVTAAKIGQNEVTTTELDDTIDLETMRSRDGTVTGAVDMGTNPGAFGAILDAVVDGNDAAGTEESYTLSLDGTGILKIYAESDGAGGVQNPRVEFLQPGLLPVQSSAPSDTTQGNAYYDSGDDTPKWADGSAYQRPLARPNVDMYSTDESGTVNSGNAGVVGKTNLADGETLNIYRAALTLDDGQPAPSGVDLAIITEDNAGAATKQVTVLSGDGSTVYDKETGSPLASYTYNPGDGSTTTVAVVVDNGNFNSGSGANQDIFAEFRGEIQ